MPRLDSIQIKLTGDRCVIISSRESLSVRMQNRAAAGSQHVSARFRCAPRRRMMIKIIAINATQLETLGILKNGDYRGTFPAQIYVSALLLPHGICCHRWIVVAWLQLAILLQLLPTRYFSPPGVVQGSETTLNF